MQKEENLYTQCGGEGWVLETQDFTVVWSSFGPEKGRIFILLDS